MPGWVPMHDSRLSSKAVSVRAVVASLLIAVSTPSYLLILISCTLLLSKSFHSLSLVFLFFMCCSKIATLGWGWWVERRRDGCNTAFFFSFQPRNYIYCCRNCFVSKKKKKSFYLQLSVFLLPVSSSASPGVLLLFTILFPTTLLSGGLTFNTSTPEAG